MPPAQTLELPTCPAHQVGVDAQQRCSQLLAIELAVVVDPATNAGIVNRGQILQGFVAAMVNGPSPDGPADGLQCFWTGSRPEAMHVAMPMPDRLPGSESEAKKIERLIRVIATPVHILAVDDLRLLRMQRQLADREAIRQRLP